MNMPGSCFYGSSPITPSPNNAMLSQPKPSLPGGQQSSTEHAIFETQKKYIIHLELCMDDNHLMSCFEQFLRSEHNVASLNFLRAIDEYVDSFGNGKSIFLIAKKQHNKRLKAKEIIDKFLGETSAHQVNLPNQIRNDISKQFLTLADDQLLHIFDTARLEISVLLKCDSFVRFLKSPIFIQCIKDGINREVTSNNMNSIYKYLEKYFSKIGEKKILASDSSSSLSPTGLSPVHSCASSDTSTSSSDLSTATHDKNLSIDERFKQIMTDINIPIVQDRHFDLLHDLVTMENLWVPVHEDDESAAFVSERKFYHNKRGLKIYKELGILEATLDEVKDALLDMRVWNNIEENVVDIQYERYYKNVEHGSKYSMSYLSSRLKLGWPMTDRQYVIGTTVREEKVRFTGYTILKKSMDSSTIKLRKNCILSTFLGGVLVERVSDKHTRYISSGFVDMGGNFPLALFNKLLSLKASKGVEGVKKAIRTRQNMTPDERIVTSESSYRMIDTLTDFLEMHSKN